MGSVAGGCISEEEGDTEEEEDGGVKGVALAFSTVTSAEETDGTGEGGREDTTVVIGGGNGGLDLGWWYRVFFTGIGIVKFSSSF